LLKKKITGSAKNGSMKFKQGFETFWVSVKKQTADFFKSIALPKGGHFKDLRLKTKIRLVLLILFAVVTMIGMLGGYYVQRTATHSILVLKDNYLAIDYAQKMSQAINDMTATVTLQGAAESYRRQELRKASDKFELYMNMLLSMNNAKDKNIDESLRRDYDAFSSSLKSLDTLNEVTTEVYMQKLNLQGRLQAMHDLNEKVILQRTEEATKMANRVTMGMVILGALFFLFAIFAMFYFPSYVADPIQSMTQSIQQIAQKNYSQRIKIESGDDFGEMAKSFNTMAEKLEEYDNTNMSQLLNEKKRTETIVSNMNEAIIGLDDNKKILFANPPALLLIGLQEEAELIGQDARQMARQYPILQNLIKEVLNNEVKDNRSFPAISVDKDGKRHYFNKDVLRVVSPGEDPDGPNSVGYIIILKNVTELKEQDLAKTNFMATLSHELKTPIAAIDMSVNLLEDERIGHLNGEQWDLTGTIRLNTARILKMVNEILDISRIETGQLQLELENVQPENIVLRALDNVKTFIAEKSVGIIQHIQPELPALHVDLHKTTAVLVNLLTNAVRYSTENGSIEISVQRQNSSLQFTVTDKGPGISEEEQRKLFQPYRRAAGDKTKGTGLGLAISKEFVEAHGGRIWVKSKVGKGSTFGFALPV